MTLFPKNPDDVKFSGGKKHWTDVIKNSGPGDLLVWRQPEEDFNTASTLIVMPGEEAIFIKGGGIEQSFDNGTYKLSTENYPFLSRLRNAFSGGISTFSCVVYFIRKAHSMEILWGTSSPIQVRDPVMMIATGIRARGAFKVQIENGAKFLTKLLGNNVQFALQSELTNYFSNEFQQHIKSSIARAIINTKREILGVCAEQDRLAAAIQPILAELLVDYGIRLISFSIAGIDIPENDPNREKLENAFANKGVMNILGTDWGRQQATEVLHDRANNGVMDTMAQQMFAPMQPPQPAQQAPAQAFGRYTQEPAGGAEAKDGASVADEIIKLKGLLDAGVLTDEEFVAMKKKLLGL
jgi:membrane protease subunit (stomatin/prohibitin family)